MLLLRVVIGTLWGGFVFIAGLSIAGRYATQLAGAENALRFGGIGLAALGMFIFCCVVADRIFPRADPRLCAAIELLFGLVPITALLYVLVFVIRLNLSSV
jgi:hypothetical protein